MVGILDEYQLAGRKLPLLQDAISFAVVMPDGTTSNSWRVWTQGGDAYVCCRDNMTEIKVSLHQSGRQHIAFRQEAGIEMTPGDRFWNRWVEPPPQNPAVPSFKLFLPVWGVRLSEADRHKTKEMKRKWDRNLILINGDDEHLVTVSLIIVDVSTRLNLVGDYPLSLIGVLPLGKGKKLHVVAAKEPDRAFRDKIEQAVAQIQIPEANSPTEGLEGDEPLVVCMSGNIADKYAFMVAVPVRLRDEAN